MIKSWKHKGLFKFYTTGSTAGIQANHKFRLKIILSIMTAATDIKDLNLPGFNLHKLKGSKNDYYSIKVNGNWRITFKFINSDIYIVNYEDYH